MVLELLREINQDCSFTEAIQESDYTECVTKQNSGQQNDTVSSSKDSKNSSKNSKNPNKNYKTLVDCILANHNVMYQHIPPPEQKIFLQKLVMEICSCIDEKPENFWDNFGFNSKCMKSSLVQIAFQLAEQNKNMISVIYYLNEYFQHHFVLVRNDKMYETSLKNYPREYILYDSGFSIVGAADTWTKGEQEQLFNVMPITNDLSKDYRTVHKMPLQSIGKYKLPELKGFAVEYDIPLQKNGKNKVKQELYDEINLYKLNHI